MTYHFTLLVFRKGSASYLVLLLISQIINNLISLTILIIENTKKSWQTFVNSSESAITYKKENIYKFYLKESQSQEK